MKRNTKRVEIGDRLFKIMGSDIAIYIVARVTGFDDGSTTITAILDEGPNDSLEYVIFEDEELGKTMLTSGREAVKRIVDASEPKSRRFVPFFRPRLDASAIV